MRKKLVLGLIMLVQVSLAFANEDERNDTRAQANPLGSENSGQTDSYYAEGDIVLVTEDGLVTKSAYNPATGDIYGRDHDYYYVDVTEPGIIPVTFMCNTAGSGGIKGGKWEVSVLNGSGVEQSGYPVLYTQCHDTINGGFPLEVYAPATGRYYIEVVSPSYTITESEETKDNKKIVTRKIAKVLGEFDYSNYSLKIGKSFQPTPLVSAATGQIGSLLESDFYSIAGSQSSAVSVSFTCNNSVNSPKPGDWVIQTYDTNRYLLASYTVNYTQCLSTALGGKGVFVFSVDATGQGTYYVQVKGPWFNYDAGGGPILTGVLDNSDYKLTRSTSTTNTGTTGTTTTTTPTTTTTSTNTGTTGQVIKTVLIDRSASDRDEATVYLAGCGSAGQGRLVVAGKGLELSGLGTTVPITIKIGDMICSSTSPDLTKTAKTGFDRYQYPAPKAPEPKTGAGAAGR